MKDPQQRRFLGYRILGVFNNFIAVLFLFSVIVNFGAVGFYPPLLLPLFIAFSILIYTNLSAVFARQVLLDRKPLKHRLKDWIKVNAYVTLIYSAFQFALLLIALLGTTLIEKLGSNFGVPAGTIRGMVIFLMGSSILFIVHVILTFRYLRSFKDYFQHPPQ